MKPEKPLYLDVAKQFKKDINHCKRQDKDLDKLWDVVETLRNRKTLDPKHKKHSLFGQYKNSCEYHIKPDWLLIWDIEGDALRLIRTGSHSELFEEWSGTCQHVQQRPGETGWLGRVKGPAPGQ